MIACLLSLSLIAPLSDAALPAFSGCWVGTLTYRDYSDNSMEKLGTLLRIWQPRGSTGWTFRYVYDDGPKKVVQESDSVAIDLAAHTYVVTSDDDKDVSRYTVDASGLKPGGLGKLILTGKGTENQVEVDIRQTVTISADHLDILRESRRKGEAFKFRHAYAFTKVSDQ